VREPQGAASGAGDWMSKSDRTDQDGANQDSRVSAIIPQAMAVLALFLCVLLMSCAGGSSLGAPTCPPSNSNTVTITAAGVSAKELSVEPRTRVLFLNSDSRRHGMRSDPHPQHDCTEINSVGSLTPGQSCGTGNRVAGRTRGFHDQTNLTIPA
jgi:hypothetical protein